LHAVESGSNLFGVTAPDSSLPNNAAGITDSRYQLKSVGRALRLMEILAEHADHGLSVTEAASLLGASKSATFSMLQTLVAFNFATDSERGPRYRLGPAVLRLADSHTRSNPLVALVRPHLRSLTEETGWTSRLASHQDGYPVFIDRVDGPGSIRFFTSIGIREQPHHSAAGKAILAELDESSVRLIARETGLPRRTRHTITDVTALLADLALIRTRGFAVDDGEDETGILCLGAAFSGRDGRPLGAVSITGLKAEVPDWKVQELGSIVRAHADQMTLAVGGTARSTGPNIQGTE
jgi:IclR family transcriptional regulator, acetate operon repressor